jgi:hypothetical protein
MAFGNASMKLFGSAATTSPESVFAESGKRFRQNLGALSDGADRFAMAEAFGDEAQRQS